MKLTKYIIVSIIFLSYFFNGNSQDFFDKIIEIEPLKINTRYSEFGAIDFGDKIIYCSNTPEGKKKKKDHKFYGIYVFNKLSDRFDISDPTFFNDNIKSKFNDGPLFYSPGENKIYFTKNTKKKDKRDRHQLKVYESSFKNGKFERPKLSSFNTPRYSTAHVSVSKDGKTLIFSSNRRGGKSRLADLWMAKKDNSNKWTKPQNLTLINSVYRDVFPYIDNHGNLYFSSNRKGSIGRLDIYLVKDFLMGEREITHLPEPINSKYDDFSFVYYDDMNYGYFASNRKGGKGTDDIYRFEIDDAYLVSTDKSTDVTKNNIEKKESKIEFVEKVTETIDNSIVEKEIEKKIESKIEHKIKNVSSSYKIQVLAINSDRKDNPDLVNRAKDFLNSEDVVEDKEGGYRKFLVGDWSELKKAQKALKKYRENIKNDAFIVRYENGERIESLFSDVADAKRSNYKIQVLALYINGKDNPDLLNNAQQHFDNTSFYKKIHEGYRKYLFGDWESLDEAKKELQKYITDVYNDAFIVQYENGKRGDLIFPNESVATVNEKINGIDEEVYKIQVLALFIKGKDNPGLLNNAKEYFNSNKFHEQIHEGYRKYLFGDWQSLNNARETLNDYKNKVFDDAFIVLYKNNERIKIIF